jgi:hypothetical protein
VSGKGEAPAADRGGQVLRLDFGFRYGRATDVVPPRSMMASYSAWAA